MFYLPPVGEGDFSRTGVPFQREAHKLVVKIATKIHNFCGRENWSHSPQYGDVQVIFSRFCWNS